MNSNFKKLAEEAGLGKERWNTTEEFNLFLDRFADLIVNDMIRVVAAHSLMGDSALDVFKNLKRIYEREN